MSNKKIVVEKTEYVILNGGIEHTVAHEDGRTESVKIRLVPMPELDALARAWGREADEIPVYTGKDQAWAGCLSEASWAEVVQIGRALNFTRASGWFTRQKMVTNALGIDVKELVETQV